MTDNKHQKEVCPQLYARYMRVCLSYYVNVNVIFIHIVNISV